MSAELDELIEACRGQPASSFLLKALLEQAKIADGAWEAVDYLGEASPEPFDAALRSQVAAFLREAGREDAAQIWAPKLKAATTAHGGAQVVDLSNHRSAAEREAISVAAERLTFDDVGGLDGVKREITRRIIAPFQKPGLFAAFKRRAGGGVLMYGPPGCGKTMLARATAGEAGAAFLMVEIADVLDMYIGQSEKRLTAIFEEAREKKPAVIFFDEIEALAAQRRYGSDHKSSLVSTFLSLFDGLSAKQDGVLVLAATNVPWAVDAAFRRPGRFDRVLFVPPPDREARQAILKRLLHDRPTANDIDAGKLAGRTSGFSGADLMNVVETAIDLAIEESGDGETVTPIAMRHLEAALQEARPTTVEWLTTARNYAKHANQGGLYDEVKAFLDKNAK